MRTVVYVLVLLVVVGMILTMVGSALAATATPTAISSSTNALGAPHADQPSRPAPVVVLGTHNLTWSDLQSEVSRTSAGEGLGSGDVGPSRLDTAARNNGIGPRFYFVGFRN